LPGAAAGTPPPAGYGRIIPAGGVQDARIVPKVEQGVGWQLLYSEPVSHAVERSMHLTAVFRKVPEGYIGFVEELPGANTQGATLEEARANLSEAVELVFDANRALAEEAIAGQDVIREPLVIAVG
jgi:predicted RNase H-like HicB family nuclease